VINIYITKLTWDNLVHHETYVWFYLHGHSLLRDGHQVVDEVGRLDCGLRLWRPTMMNPQRSGSSYRTTVELQNYDNSSVSTDDGQNSALIITMLF
jgi:hypothetical protein